MTNYHSGGEPGRTWESFVVGGKKFEYAERIGGMGFHRTHAQGGPISQRVRVRIAYGWAGADAILRVEVDRSTPVTRD